MAGTVRKEDKKLYSLDWLVGGVLSKLGDTFDRLVGRNWNPSSNLATSRLIEKLHSLLDSEVRDLGGKGKFVPHIFKLRIQWNKFSTDSEEDLRNLEQELHASAIDHINDMRYHTYAPLDIKIVTDYFIEGVRFIAGFGDFANAGEDEIDVNVTLSNLKTGGTEMRDQPAETGKGAPTVVQEAAEYWLVYTLNGKRARRSVSFAGARRLSMGRAGTNDIVIDHPSVSKMHAAMALDREGGLVIADTGSTNGTFVNGSRIAYGIAAKISVGAAIRLGSVNLALDRAEPVKSKEDLHAALPAGKSAVDIESPVSAGVESGPAMTEPSIQPERAGADDEKDRQEDASAADDRPGETEGARKADNTQMSEDREI